MLYCRADDKHHRGGRCCISCGEVHGCLSTCVFIRSLNTSSVDEEYVNNYCKEATNTKPDDVDTFVMTNKMFGSIWACDDRRNEHD